MHGVITMDFSVEISQKRIRGNIAKNLFIILTIAMEQVNSYRLYLPIMNSVLCIFFIKDFDFGKEVELYSMYSRKLCKYYFFI